MTFHMPIRAVLIVAAVAVVAALAVLTFRPTAAEAQACAGADGRTSVRSAERAVHCLINHERTKRGLRSLRRDRRLVGVARRHTRDQVRYRFVGHRSPARGSLVTRMKRSGFGRGKGSWTFGEILGGGRGRNYHTPRWIVAAWMRRPIHRKAILHPGFKALGVGGTRGTPSGGKRRGGRNFVVTFGG